MKLPLRHLTKKHEKSNNKGSEMEFQEFEISLVNLFSCEQ